MNNPQQLIFPWTKKSVATFDHFYVDDLNLPVKDALLKEDDLFLYGIAGTGKTFLLQSLCNHYTDCEKTSLFIPLNEVKEYGAGFLDSLEELDLICIDQIDSIAGDDIWEVAIFNLINNCLTSKCRLIFCSRLNPSSINFNLKDLFSRIKRIDHIELLPVSENNLRDALKFITDLRSLEIGDSEINYLMTHSTRSITNILEIIDELDLLSLKLKRRITIPLIKEFIQN